MTPTDSGSVGFGEDPIIVTGAPRSGVRLLATILDGHPALASGPDLPFVATLVQQWRSIESNLAANHSRHHGVQPHMSRAAFRTAALKLLAPRLRRARKQRFVLQSFTAAVLLEPFAGLFPNARFVFMVRDPRDVAHSLLRCDWRDVRDGKRFPYTQDPVAAAQFSVDFMTLAMQHAQALHAAGRLMMLRYEELCRDAGGTMARLGAFLRESAPRPCVMPDSSTLVTTAPDNPHPRLRDGVVDSASIARWRDGGSILYPRPLDAAIEQLRSKLGYHR
jgi:hypothetical protein